MTHHLKSIAIVGVCAALAGCSSNSTGLGGLTSVTEVNDAADTMAAANSFDMDTGLFSVATRTDAEDVTANNASYEGFIAGDLGGGEEIAGELAMTVDFTGGTDVSGTADNFYHNLDGAYTGTLTMAGGAVDPGALVGDPSLLQGTLSGTLSNGGTDYATNIALDGEFTGGAGAATPTAVGGFADGNVGGDILIGSFIAELQ